MTIAAMQKLPYAGRYFPVRADARLWLEMEDELGSLQALARRLNDGGWTLAEVVAAVQMLLAASGCIADYMLLADDMLSRGLGEYCRVLRRLLICVTGEEPQ